MNPVVANMHRIFNIGSRHSRYTWALGVLDALLKQPERHDLNELHQSDYSQGYNDYLTSNPKG